MNKIILHVDMDAFFAAVEQMDNPNLKGMPVIVGGISERGVVSTCSYEARKYGVHSGMPIFIAQKLCPHGIYLKSRYYRYKEISNKIFEIFREVTELVEPLSIDEAYLDVTNSYFKNGLEAAKYIKKRVYRELSLTLSIGISYNKFLAKLASDWNKPSGVKIITKEMIPKILFPLSISKIYGLGSKSVKKLNDMGFFTIGELYEMPINFYVEYLGKNGLDIYYRIRGIDNREISVCRDRKSYGKERTLKTDTNDKEELLLYLKEFSLFISKELKSKNIKGKTITIKYKTRNFESHTRSRTLNYYTNDYDDFFKISSEIIELETFKDRIRLIGMTISSFMESSEEQLSIFK
ncbi:DNA polymerase IV [Clostridium septicum]|uniref:DNA polymerase IV n=1 Tax=Clostridium septicum TaxID=1504 RepID=A0A9N7JIX5_CLOSE|nr:DNA polymerase IV [Clostridium septicum]AYE33389.1 DNA polymerase IV [Clostridium septicum]MDU1314004.1 DNA polymerase IV [Clostridium septicum]QAS61561.1 DNA polymerase IV [Clostridium septicum]UEC22001.1 DNA polymerase IV [Clostridium septicum]USR99966.1 DNA polymerase IV [Clostridium septicum]